jgi:uncharacterized integral membrane protein
MRRFLKGLILLPIAIVVVLLAVANRAPVTLSFDPFSKGAPQFSTTLPLFAIIFAAVMLGVLIGGVAAWLAQSKHRRLERRYRREARQLRSETERFRTHTGSSGLPALSTSQSSRL